MGFRFFLVMESLAFDGTCAQAADVIALQQEEHEQAGNRRDGGARAEQTIVDGAELASLHIDQRHGQRIFIGIRNHDEGRQEIVPSEDERIQGRRGHAGLDDRQQGPEQDAETRQAVNHGAFLEFLRHCREAAAHDQRAERQLEGGVDEDEADEPLGIRRIEWTIKSE